ncbi:hypothetical protein ACU8L2_23715 [Rhizobium leguminosarum]
MWPFSKPKKPILQDARKAVDELRYEFSDEVLENSFSVNERVNRLRSVGLEFFNELLGVTDDVSDRVIVFFENRRLNALEFHAFCASTVAVAVHLSEVPTDEKPSVIDIYLDLWIESVKERNPQVNRAELKATMERLWTEYSPFMMRAAVEEEAIKAGFENPPLVLARNLDRLCNVTRGNAEQEALAAAVKGAVVHAITSVRAI